MRGRPRQRVGSTGAVRGHREGAAADGQPTCSLLPAGSDPCAMRCQQIVARRGDERGVISGAVPAVTRPARRPTRRRPARASSRRQYQAKARLESSAEAGGTGHQTQQQLAAGFHRAAPLDGGAECTSLHGGEQLLRVVADQRQIVRRRAARARTRRRHRARRPSARSIPAPPFPRSRGSLMFSRKIADRWPSRAWRTILDQIVGGRLGLGADALDRDELDAIGAAEIMEGVVRGEDAPASPAGSRRSRPSAPGRAPPSRRSACRRWP